MWWELFLYLKFEFDILVSVRGQLSCYREGNKGSFVVSVFRLAISFVLYSNYKQLDYDTGDLQTFNGAECPAVNLTSACGSGLNSFGCEYSSALQDYPDCYTTINCNTQTYEACLVTTITAKTTSATASSKPKPSNFLIFFLTFMSLYIVNVALC